MDTLDKLQILAEAARFDVACTSSGVNRGPEKGRLGCARAAGCCHSFTPDGRCITLLKVLMTNVCSFDCAYCVNRRSASTQRASFAPRELAELTLDFYKRNYIEGLFLSSGVVGCADATVEKMCECIRILRDEFKFNGYIHAKVIPGTSPELIHILGLLADRLSVNLELPSAESLAALCPEKGKADVLEPMALIKSKRDNEALMLGKPTTTFLDAAKGNSAGDPRSFSAHSHALSQRKRQKPAHPKRRFAPAGQSTQLIVGATEESDHHILSLSASLYKHFELKRVFFSAYIPMLEDPLLPALEAPVPLRREHRLYQADWLMRYYAFSPDELVGVQDPWLDLELDPKLAWALRNIHLFPLEIMDASFDDLIRIPGIGLIGARRIVSARKHGLLSFDDLKRMRLTLKRAKHFISCNGKRADDAPLDEVFIRRRVIEDAQSSRYNATRRALEGEQLTLFS